MNLAKDCVDIGLRTNQLDSMLGFWTCEVGLQYEELLKVGGGIHQHRLSLNGSTLKLNHSRDPLPDTPKGGYRELLIASDVDRVKHLTDPDGNRVTLVPWQYEGISHIAMRISVSSLPKARLFYSHTLLAEAVADNVFRLGTTLLILQEFVEKAGYGRFAGKGYRYLTIRVNKVDIEHLGLLERGARQARRPETLGPTARISFITDPDGNWIGLSQRASLTDDLAPEIQFRPRFANANVGLSQ